MLKFVDKPEKKIVEELIGSLEGLDKDKVKAFYKYFKIK